MTKEPRHCCAHRGCTEWATHGSYCQKHYEQFLERQKEKKKKKFQTWQEYKKQTGYERPPEQKLYNCQRWRKTSQLYLIQHPVCEICGRPATAEEYRDSKCDYKRCNVLKKVDDQKEIKYPESGVVLENYISRNKKIIRWLKKVQRKVRRNECDDHQIIIIQFYTINNINKVDKF